MNREQIIAWLTLEGWAFHPRGEGKCDHAWRRVTGSEVEIVTVRPGHDARYHRGYYIVHGRCNDYSGATDEQLGLIYQELINHENRS